MGICRRRFCSRVKQRRIIQTLAIVALAVLTLVAYMNRRKIRIVLKNTFHGLDAKRRNLKLAQEQLRRPLKAVKEEGDFLDGAKGIKTCRRAWQRGSSSWFDERYNESIPALWTARNRELRKEVRDWWLVSRMAEKKISL